MVSSTRMDDWLAESMTPVPLFDWSVIRGVFPPGGDIEVFVNTSADGAGVAVGTGPQSNASQLFTCHPRG